MYRFLRACLLVVLVFLPHGELRAQARRPVCISALLIADFDGAPADYRFTRGGRPARLANFAPLQTRDELQVLASGRSLTVQLSNRSTRRLTRQDGPQCIVRPGASVGGNARREFGELITQRRLGRWYGIGRGDGDAGGPFRLAFQDLLAGNAMVSAGDRRMALSWFGGEPPFIVDVVAPGGRAIVHEERIYERILLLNEPRRLSAGFYLVRVRDARGEATEGRFRAGHFPPAAPMPASADTALLAAADLYAAGPDRTLDAFMLLSPFYEERSTAGWMMLLLTEQRPQAATHAP